MSKKKTWVLVSVSHRRVEKNGRGKPYIVESEYRPDPPPEINPRKNSVTWENVYEVVADPKHRGKPIYELRESQPARVTKIVGPTRQ